MPKSFLRPLAAAVVGDGRGGQRSCRAVGSAAGGTGEVVGEVVGRHREGGLGVQGAVLVEAVDAVDRGLDGGGKVEGGAAVALDEQGLADMGRQHGGTRGGGAGSCRYPGGGCGGQGAPVGGDAVLPQVSVVQVEQERRGRAAVARGVLPPEFRRVGVLRQVQQAAEGQCALRFDAVLLCESRQRVDGALVAQDQGDGQVQVMGGGARARDRSW